MSKSTLRPGSSCEKNAEMNSFNTFTFFIVLRKKPQLYQNLSYFVMSWLFVSHTCNKETSTTDLKSSSQHWSFE